jgi:hypothetical protein
MKTIKAYSSFHPNRAKENMESFSLNSSLLKDILQYARPLGHYENQRNLNIGFGFLYYGLVRAIRPEHALVIGSGYGFSVVCLALGMKDNGSGEITFVDPSYSLMRDGPFKTIGGQNKWDEPKKVHEHFRQFGVAHVVKHYKLKSDEFFPSYNDFELPSIDIAFIDGNHSYKSVSYDFMGVLEHSHKNSYVFLHDTNIYFREFVHHSSVKRCLKTLIRERDFFEVINFPFSSGVALVRVKRNRPRNHIS